MRYLKHQFALAWLFAISSCAGDQDDARRLERQLHLPVAERDVVLAKLPPADVGHLAGVGGDLKIENQCIYISAPGIEDKERKFLIVESSGRARWRNGALEVKRADGSVDRLMVGDPIVLTGSGRRGEELLEQMTVKPWPECEHELAWKAHHIRRDE